VEVKLVNHVLDIHDYITPTKLKHLHKTIEFYLREHKHDGDIQMDVIFVRYDEIIQHIKNVTGGR
jgi:Holliday junction resolvase-like predicted endonuclease